MEDWILLLICCVVVVIMQLLVCLTKSTVITIITVFLHIVAMALLFYFELPVSDMLLFMVCSVTAYFIFREIVIYSDKKKESKKQSLKVGKQTENNETVDEK